MNTKPTSMKFIKDFFKYAPSSIIPAIIGFLTIPLLTKIFEPNIYGDYVLTISIVSLFSLIIETLWGNPATRFFQFYKKKETLSEFYDTLLFSTIISICLVSVLYGVLLVLNKNNLTPTFYFLMEVGIILFIIMSFFGIIKRLLIVREKAGYYSFFIVFQSILGFIFSIFLILYFKIGIVGLIIGNIISFIIILPFSFSVAFKGIKIGKKISNHIIIKMVKFGAPLLLSNLSGWILNISDKYILNFFKGSFEVGIYSAGYDLSQQSISMIWTIFMTASYPLIIRMWENHGEKPTQQYITKLTRYYLLISIPAALGLSVIAKPLIEIITSPAYYDSYKIIPFVAFSAVLLGLQWFAQLGLLVHNKTSKISMAVIASGFLNISLNFMLIPIYGFIAAAITTLIAYIALLALMIKISNKFLIWKFPVKFFFKIFFASILMSFSIYLVQFFLISNWINLIIQIFIALCIYSITILVLDIFDADEISKLRRMYKSFKKW